MLPRFEPDKPYDFNELNRVIDAINSFLQSRAATTPQFSSGLEQSAQRVDLLPDFDARVTERAVNSAGVAAYAWVESIQDADGTWQDKPGGRFGSTDFWPLYEANGADIGIGWICRVRYGQMDLTVDGGSVSQTFITNIAAGSFWVLALIKAGTVEPALSASTSASCSGSASAVGSGLSCHLLAAATTAYSWSEASEKSDGTITKKIGGLSGTPCVNPAVEYNGNDSAGEAGNQALVGPKADLVVWLHRGPSQTLCDGTTSYVWFFFSPKRLVHVVVSCDPVTGNVIVTEYYA